MILVPLRINLKQPHMQTPRQNTPDEESNDRNRQPDHDPAQAGPEAIEASKLNERGKPSGQQQAEEERDADEWRNEG